MVEAEADVGGEFVYALRPFGAVGGLHVGVLDCFYVVDFPNGDPFRVEAGGPGVEARSSAEAGATESGDFQKHGDMLLFVPLYELVGLLRRNVHPHC